MDNLRLDKWLWCSRFLKTRALAQDIINLGRVTVNGLTAKPAKTIVVGDEIVIKLPPFEYHIQVLGLSGQRLAAPLARLLYRESPESIQARRLLSETLRLSAIAEARTPGKLDKRDRRAREHMKRESWHSDL